MTGIYFLIHKKKVVYIGQTIHFPMRLAGHIGKEFDSVRFFPCDKDLLLTYETRWIQRFNPILNIRLKQNEARIQKSINLNVSLWDKIEAKAEKEKRTMSNLLETIIEKEFVQV